MKLKTYMIIEVFLIAIGCFYLFNCISYNKFVQNISYTEDVNDKENIDLNILWKNLNLSEYKIVEENNTYNVSIKEENNLNDIERLIENILGIPHNFIENSRFFMEIKEDKYILDYTFSTKP